MDVLARLYQKPAAFSRGHPIGYATKMIGTNPQLRAEVVSSMTGATPEQKSKRLLNYRNAQALSEQIRHWCIERYGEKKFDDLVVLDMNTRSGFVSNALLETGFKNVYFSTAPTRVLDLQQSPFIAEHVSAIFTPAMEQELTRRPLGASVQHLGLYHAFDPTELEVISAAIDPDVGDEKTRSKLWSLLPFDVKLLRDACMFNAAVPKEVKQLLEEMRQFYGIENATPRSDSSLTLQFCYGYVQDCIQRVHFMLIRLASPKTTDRTNPPAGVMQYVHARNVLTTLLERMKDALASSERVRTDVISSLADASESGTANRMQTGDINALESFFALDASGSRVLLAPQVVIVNPDWNQTYQEWLLFLINLRSLAESSSTEMCIVWWEPETRNFTGLYPLATLAIPDTASLRERKCKERLHAAHKLIEEARHQQEQQQKQSAAVVPRKTPRERMFDLFHNDGTEVLLKLLGLEIEVPWLKRIEQILTHPTPLPPSVMDLYFQRHLFPMRYAQAGQQQTKTYHFMNQITGPLRFCFFIAIDRMDERVFQRRTGSNVPFLPKTVEEQFQDSVGWNAQGSTTAPLFLDRVFGNHQQIESRWSRFLSLLPARSPVYQFDPDTVMEATTDLLDEKTQRQRRHRFAEDVVFNAPRRIVMLPFYYATSTTSGSGGSKESDSSGATASERGVIIELLPSLPVDELKDRFVVSMRRILFDEQAKPKKDSERVYARIIVTGMFATETALLEIRRLLLQDEAKRFTPSPIQDEIYLFHSAITLLCNLMIFVRSSRQEAFKTGPRARSAPIFISETELKNGRQQWVNDLTGMQKALISYEKQRNPKSTSENKQQSLQPRELAKRFAGITQWLLALSDHADRGFPMLFYRETKNKDQQFLRLEISLYEYARGILTRTGKGPLKPESSEIFNLAVSNQTSELSKNPAPDLKTIGGIYSGGMIVPFEYKDGKPMGAIHAPDARTEEDVIMHSFRTKSYGLSMEAIHEEKKSFDALLHKYSHSFLALIMVKALSYRNAHTTAQIARSILVNLHRLTTADDQPWEPYTIYVDPTAPFEVRGFRAVMGYDNCAVIHTVPDLGGLRADVFSAYPETAEPFTGDWEAAMIELMRSSHVDYAHLTFSAILTPQPDQNESGVQHPILENVLQTLGQIIRDNTPESPKDRHPLLLSFVIPGRRNDVNNHGFEEEYDTTEKKWVPRVSDFTKYIEAFASQFETDDRETDALGPTAGETGRIRPVRIFQFPLGPLAIVYVLINSPIDDRQFRQIIPRTLELIQLNPNRKTRNVKQQQHKKRTNTMQNASLADKQRRIVQAAVRSYHNTNIGRRKGNQNSHSAMQMKIYRRAGSHPAAVLSTSTLTAQLADTVLRGIAAEHKSTATLTADTMATFLRTGEVTPSVMMAARELVLNQDSKAPAALKADLMRTQETAVADLKQMRIRVQKDLIQYILANQSKQEAFRAYLLESKSQPNSVLKKTVFDLAKSALTQERKTTAIDLQSQIDAVLQRMRTAVISGPSSVVAAASPAVAQLARLQDALREVQFYIYVLSEFTDSDF